MASETVRKNCTIQEEHDEYIKEHDLNASYILRKALEKRMREDKK